MRGGERVLHQLALRHPDADCYTLVHVPGSTTPEIDALRIHASPLNLLPGVERHYRKLLPLFPWAIDRFRLDDYDLVLSISHAVAKSVPVAPGTVHVDYCLTPMRYVWDQADAYLGSGVRRLAATPLVRALRRFDVARSLVHAPGRLPTVRSHRLQRRPTEQRHRRWMVDVEDDVLRLRLGRQRVGRVDDQRRVAAGRRDPVALVVDRADREEGALVALELTIEARPQIERARHGRGDQQDDDRGAFEQRQPSFESL